MGRRTSAVVAGGLALSMALAACGGVGDSPGRKESKPGAKVELTTMGFGLPDEIAKVRHRAALKAIAPSTVRLSESGFDEQQFLSAVASGKEPDLIYVGREKLGTYVKKGTLAPLTKCIRDEKIDMGQYRTAAVDGVTVDGTVYALPEFYSNRVMYIDDSVLASAGLQPSDVDTSDWAKLTDLAERLTKRDGKKLRRIGFDPKLPEFFPLWAKANGVDLISADGERANLDDPRAVEALTFANSLVQKQGGWSAFKSFRDSFDFFGAKNEFAVDQLGAFPMEDWYLNVLAENSPKVEITVVPMRDRTGRPLNWTTGSAWAITKASPNYRQACKYIETITDSTSWVAASQARADARKRQGKPYTGTYTGNAEADKDIFGKVYRPGANPVFDKAVAGILEAQKNAYTMPTTGAGAEFTAAWESAVNRVLSGHQKPKAALEQAQREAQKALDEAGR